MGVLFIIEFHTTVMVERKSVEITSGKGLESNSANGPQDTRTGLHSTNKKVMSHYFGFGNISVDKLSSTPGIATRLEPSGKFKEKLMLK